MTMQTFKVVILGASGTGKTSLTVRFVNDDFVENYDPTIEDLYRKVIETSNGDNFMLEIMDTSGTERYLAMRDLYIRNAQAFVLVYSITSRVSLLELENIKNYICMVKEKPISQIPIVVLGNKCDLEDNRAVFPEEVESLTKKWGVGDFLETSAKIDMNIQSSFDCLVRQLLTKPTANGTNGKKSEKKEKKSSNLSISSSCSTNSNLSSTSSSSINTLSSSISSSSNSIGSAKDLNSSGVLTSSGDKKEKKPLSSFDKKRKMILQKRKAGKCLIM